MTASRNTTADGPGCFCPAAADRRCAERDLRPAHHRTPRPADRCRSATMPPTARSRPAARRRCRPNATSSSSPPTHPPPISRCAERARSRQSARRPPTRRRIAPPTATVPRTISGPAAYPAPPIGSSPRIGTTRPPRSRPAPRHDCPPSPTSTTADPPPGGGHSAERDLEQQPRAIQVAASNAPPRSAARHYRHAFLLGDKL
jgi:hypothetical protein